MSHIEKASYVGKKNKVPVWLRSMLLTGVLVLVGIVVYFLVGVELEKYLVTSIQTNIVQCDPDYQYGENLTPTDYQAPDCGTITENQIQLPSVGTCYGEIRAEETGQSSPLYFGDSNEILEKGAGQYVESALPGFGGTVLVGGHDTGCFSWLETLKKGNQITIETAYGIFTYEVQRTSIENEENVESCELDSKEEQLILYTCYPFGKVFFPRDQRYLVYCSKIAGPVVKEK